MAFGQKESAYYKQATVLKGEGKTVSRYDCMKMLARSWMRSSQNLRLFQVSNGARPFASREWRESQFRRGCEASGSRARLIVVCGIYLVEFGLLPSTRLVRR